jgi:hypothetical protein
MQRKSEKGQEDEQKYMEYMNKYLNNKKHG